MNYRINQKNGDRLSALGFGCMRLPRDEKTAKELVVSAIEAGVNYFDTAYIYPGNEALLGRILPKERRAEIKIATKLPPYLVRKQGDAERMFTAQLARLQTDYVDYYLMHMIANAAEWDRLKGLGVLDWLERQRQDGRIRNIGFSYHGGYEDFKGLIDAHDWDFCMLQYNYFDETNQAGRKGLEYAVAKDIPVIVMEPLRGGTLASRLPKEAVAAFDGLGGGRSPAEWALRWVWNHPGVLTVLSGMNTREILAENIRAAAARPDLLTEGELAAFSKAKRAILDKLHIGCTGCAYCMPCPQGVDIPMCFSCYNDMELTGKLKAKFYYIMRTNGHNASLCARCGKCERHCPQNIKIMDELAAAAKAMEGVSYKPMRFVVRRFMKLKVSAD